MIHTVTIQQPDNPDEFRSVARRLLSASVKPADVAWTGQAVGTLFPQDLPIDEKPVLVPHAFATLTQAVVCHRSELSWALLYEALWRIDQGERRLLLQQSDPLVHRLRQMETAIRRDQHRMTAFVRFRAMPDEAGEHFVAWYEPQHRVLRRASAFFADRFANMRFSILTPDLTLHWDRVSIRFAPGLGQQNPADKDAVEDWWRRYYAATFNPARTNARLMQSHMPKQFWRNLPEATAIADLLDDARARTDRMIWSSVGVPCPGLSSQLATDIKNQQAS